MASERFHFRHFLNTDAWGGIALVEATVPDSSEGDDYETWTQHITQNHTPYYSCCDLTLGDCTRQVTLEFSTSSPQHRANSRAKLELLLYTLLEFAAAFEEEARYAERVEAARQVRGLSIRDED